MCFARLFIKLTMSVICFIILLSVLRYMKIASPRFAYYVSHKLVFEKGVIMNKLYEISLRAKSQIAEVPITKETNKILHIGSNSNYRDTIRKDELMTPVGRFGTKSVFCYEEYLNEAITILLEYETDRLKALEEEVAKKAESIEKLRSQKQC